MKRKSWLWLGALGAGAYFLFRAPPAQATPAPTLQSTGAFVWLLNGNPNGTPMAARVTGTTPSATGYTVTLPQGGTWVAVNGAAPSNATAPLFYPPGYSIVGTYSWKDASGMLQQTTIS